MNYLKAVAAVVATVAAAVVAALTGDGVISNVEWVNVAIAGAGACAVFSAPNVPGARYTKLILAAISAVLVFLASAITDGVTLTEAVQLVVVALGAVGVWRAPYSPELEAVGRHSAPPAI
jgi:hypothetical protein